jgi:uncharacterized membrane protein YkvA (DUF1232 family)
VKDVLLATLLVFAVAAVIIIIAGAFVAWRIARSDERTVAKRIARLRFRDKIGFARSVMGDARVPLWAKFLGGATVLYLASPVDLVPDFIPLLGQLDDILIAALGGAVLLRAIPRTVIEEHLASYEAEQ